jgi:hypothetical protein
LQFGLHKRKPLSVRIAFAAHQRALLVEMVTLGPAGFSVGDLRMLCFHLLSYQLDAVPFRQTDGKSGSSRLDRTVLSAEELAQVDAAETGSHRHVPRRADVQLQLDLFFFNQLGDCVVDLVELFDELRPSWVAERGHLASSVLE